MDEILAAADGQQCEHHRAYMRYHIMPSLLACPSSSLKKRIEKKIAARTCQARIAASLSAINFYHPKTRSHRDDFYLCAFNIWHVLSLAVIIIRKLSKSTRDRCGSLLNNSIKSGLLVWYYSCWPFIGVKRARFLQATMKHLFWHAVYNSWALRARPQ